MSLGEFTVPWEGSIAEVRERQMLSYEELVPEIQEKENISELMALEIGCRCFSTASLRRLINSARQISKLEMLLTFKL